MDATIKAVQGGTLEFEAHVAAERRLQTLEHLRFDLGVDELKVSLKAGSVMIGFAVPLPESAVDEVKELERIEWVLDKAGCDKVGVVAIRR